MYQSVSSMRAGVVCVCVCVCVCAQVCVYIVTEIVGLSEWHR